MGLAIEDDLELIKHIFMLAKNNNRTNDFTKANAYEGLIKIYKIELDFKTLNKKEKEDKLLQY